MCGIFGTIGKISPATLHRLLTENLKRGADGLGAWHFADGEGALLKFPGSAPAAERRENVDTMFEWLCDQGRGMILANFRAEPTTEIVKHPSVLDQQPYFADGWTIVHNGTIANDRGIRNVFGVKTDTIIDSAVIPQLLAKFERETPNARKHEIFDRTVKALTGSWALLAHHIAAPGIFYACDYRPLYYGRCPDEGGWYLSSVKMARTDQLMTPYSTGVLTEYGPALWQFPAVKANPKTLVVLSGGLDSTAVAAILKRLGHQVEAIHFTYGCRAGQNEIEAVVGVTNALGMPLHVIDTDIFRIIGHSRLLDGSVIDNGEAGAEQAIEWVPARNTIMASIVIGYAEANGFDHIALGINLEEAGGGYTDNVGDLYDGLNALMQWIVGYGKNLSFISPLKDMMKHEIVAAGVAADAPFQATWSCYNAGKVHCGNCGPCTMRRRAFERNGLVDPVPYDDGAPTHEELTGGE